jgi:fructokinase
VTFTVVGLGEVLWDLLPTGRQLGGAPTNFVYQAAALGARALMVTRVGDDGLGRDVISRFAHYDLSTECVQIDLVRPTGTVAVAMDDDGNPNYTFADDAAWERLTASSSALQAVQAADAVCFGTLAQRSDSSRRAIQQLVSAAPVQALKIFDVNLRCHFYCREVIEQSMRVANVLKLNDEELRILSSLFALHGTIRQRIEQLVCAFGFKMVVVTRGAMGSIIKQGSDWSELHSQPVAIADTVGAGDAFTAALTMGLLAGMSIRQVHVIATELAAYVCSKHGATPPLPRAFRDTLRVARGD